MIPLKSNRRVLTWFCVFPNNDYRNKWKRWAYISFTLFSIAISLLSCVAEMTYFLKHISNDLERSLLAIIPFLCSLSTAYVTIATYLSRHKIIATLDALSKIYAANAKEDSFHLLLEVNKRSELMWKICFFLVPLTGLSAFGSASVSAFLIRWRSDSENPKYSYHTYNVALPWDQESFWGYIAESYCNAALGVVQMFCNCNIVFFISLCQHQYAFYQMYRHSIRKLDPSNKNPNTRGFLRRLISFQISAGQFFRKSADTFSYFLFIQLIVTMLILSLAVFQSDWLLRNFDLTIVMVIFTFSFGMSVLFLYCYFGMTATECYVKMADCSYESNWIDLPVKLQKYFVLMIMHSQQPIYYHGFEVVIVNLETYTDLLRMVATYYMAFKTFTLS